MKHEGLHEEDRPTTFSSSLKRLVEQVKYVFRPDRARRALAESLQVEAATMQMLMTLLTRKQLKENGKLTDDQDVELQLAIDKNAQTIRSLGGDPDTVLQRFFEHPSELKNDDQKTPPKTPPKSIQ